MSPPTWFTHTQTAWTNATTHVPFRLLWCFPFRSRRFDTVGPSVMQFILTNLFIMVIVETFEASVEHVLCYTWICFAVYHGLMKLPACGV